MVMNGEIDWFELYRNWLQKQSAYNSAQRALDDAMSMYLEAKGPPPSRQSIEQVADLRHQMFETRTVVDAFIAARATDHHGKHNLPRHE